MEFVREQIKEKPVNRKKIAKKLGFAALCGVVFAMAACIVVLLFMPSIKAAFAAGNTENNEDSTSLENGSEESSSLLEESESESESETDTQQGNTEVVIPDISLTLEDYQELQNELYRIGKEANNQL